MVSSEGDEGVVSSFGTGTSVILSSVVESEGISGMGCPSSEEGDVSGD